MFVEKWEKAVQELTKEREKIEQEREEVEREKKLERAVMVAKDIVSAVRQAPIAIQIGFEPEDSKFVLIGTEIKSYDDEIDSIKVQGLLRAAGFKLKPQKNLTQNSKKFFVFLVDLGKK